MIDGSAGVLTLAFGSRPYIRMAKGLARSIRLHNRDVPIAIVTDRPPRSLRRWFDHVIPLDPQFGPGLAQKLYLDRYSPFERTLFLDADVLMYDDVRLLWDRFDHAHGFSLFGSALDPGEEHYAVDDIEHYLAALGLPRMMNSHTGVMYFDRSPTASRVFDQARAIARDGEGLGLQRHPVGFYNDEPIFGAAMVSVGAPFVSASDGPEADTAAHSLTLACFGTDGMARIDVRQGRSAYTLAGHHVKPVAIHFNVETQDSEVYDRELRRLDLGPLLGRTPVPDVLTRAAWSTRRARGRVRDAAWIVNGWPYTRRARRPDVTAELLVRTAAGQARAPFTFVQVGSNDGKTFDPLFATVMDNDVRGLLVEPVPQLFERLRATYAGKAGLTFVNAAVADTEDVREFHWVPPAPGDPEWVDQLGSFSRELVLSHGDKPLLAERLVTMPVSCRTLASLVAEHALDRIDLLHIDAEGSDLAILRTIDFQAGWAPDCILYEQKHLGYEASAARELLRSAGYSSVDLGPDVFAFRGLKTRVPRVIRRLGTDRRQKLL